MISFKIKTVSEIKKI